jgi:hypothetical protein
MNYLPIPMAARPKFKSCQRNGCLSLESVVGRADHPPRGVLSEYGVSECDRIASKMRPTRDSCAWKIIRIVNIKYLLSLQNFSTSLCYDI